MRKIIYTALLSLTMCFYGFSQNNKLESEIDRYILQMFDSLDFIPSVSIGVLYQGKIVLEKAYGLADVKKNIPAKASTEYYIASNTKAFTALSASILNQKGQLSFSKSLQEFFPEVQFADSVQADRITIPMLLSHTSGLDNGMITFLKAQTGDYTDKMLFDLLDDSFNRNEIGAYRYSNLGYNILNLIYLKEFGKTWKDVVQEEVLDPMGMTNTYSSYIDLLESGKQIAKPYQSLGDGVNLFEEHTAIKRDETMQAAGGLYSNTPDLLRFLLFLINHGDYEDISISKDAIANTLAKRIDVEKSNFGLMRYDTGYGLGWNISDYEGTLVYHHGGAFGGYRSYLSFSPENKSGIAVMVNDSFSGNLITTRLTLFVLDAIKNLNNPSQDWKKEHLQYLTMMKQEVENRAIPKLKDDIAKRSMRQWNLKVDLNRIAGVYFDELGNMLRAFVSNGRLNIVMGDVTASVEPFPNENTFRLDLFNAGIAKLDIENEMVKGIDYSGTYYKKMK